MLGDEDGSSYEEAHTGEAFEVLHFKIYCCSGFRSSEDVLLFEKAGSKYCAAILRPMAVYLNHETSETLMLDVDRGEVPRPRKEGFSLLLEVYPHFVNGACKAFDVARSAGPSLRSERELQRNTFMIIGSDPCDRRKVRLRDRDVIKLGREKYVVRVGRQERRRWFDRVHYQRELLEGCCRICLCEEPSHLLDYLISPCNCTGSQAFVHIDCLRRWMANRIVLAQKQRITTYAFKKHTCEICKSDLPRFISTQGEMIELMPVDSDQHSVILERVEFDSRGEELRDEKKLIHCINRREEETRTLILGRNQHCDIRLEDTSVSRTHSKLIIGPEGVELYDCFSKYGTFVMLREMESDLKAASYMSYKWRFELTIDE